MKIQSDKKVMSESNLCESYKYLQTKMEKICRSEAVSKTIHTKI